MPPLESVTPVVLTYNEEANVGRTLERLGWAERIVVLDSGSEDRTVAIVSRFTNVELLFRPFDDAASQWNHALAHVRTEWVLALDADFVVTDGLVRELAALPPEGGPDCYEAAIRYVVFGKPLPRSLLPPLPVLYRHRGARYVLDGHTQRLSHPGPRGRLSGFVDHDDRKPITRWALDQARYASLEAAKLRVTPPGELDAADRARLARLWVPLLVVPYCLLSRGLLFAGWRGVYYTLQRLVAETLLAVALIRDDLTPDEGPTGDPPPT